MMIICCVFFSSIELRHSQISCVCVFVTLRMRCVQRTCILNSSLCLYFSDMTWAREETRIKMRWRKKQKPKLLVLRSKQKKRRKVKQYKLEWELIACVPALRVCRFDRELMCVSFSFISTSFFLVVLRVDQIYVSTWCAVSVPQNGIFKINMMCKS